MRRRLRVAAFLCHRTEWGPVMLHRLRRFLLAGGIGAGLFLITLLTAAPAAAASPYARTGCASGNFTCLRAHHVVVVHRFTPVYVAPRYVAPVYAAPVYTMPAYTPTYTMPQYVAPNVMPYAPMPYTSGVYAPGMHRCFQV